MSTRAGRKFIDPCAVKAEGGGVFAPFLSILINNVRITGADTETAPPLFISKTLVMRGGVAFVPVVKEWAAFVNADILDRTGMPKRVRLVGDRGILSEPLVAGVDAFIIPANPFFVPPKNEVMRRIEMLDIISGALAQNVDALRQCTAVFYSDPDLKAAIDEAERKRLSGARTVSIKRAIGQDIELKSFCPDTRSYIPDLMDVWLQTLSELDAVTGRATVGEKNERRITEEVNVIEDAASSAIDVIIDNFNSFADWYGIEAHASRGIEKRKEEITDDGSRNPESDAGDEPGGADDTSEPK